MVRQGWKGRLRSSTFKVLEPVLLSTPLKRCALCFTFCAPRSPGPPLLIALLLGLTCSSRPVMSVCFILHLETGLGKWGGFAHGRPEVRAWASWRTSAQRRVLGSHLAEENPESAGWDLSLRFQEAQVLPISGPAARRLWCL